MYLYMLLYNYILYVIIYVLIYGFLTLISHEIACSLYFFPEFLPTHEKYVCLLTHITYTYYHRCHSALSRLRNNTPGSPVPPFPAYAHCGEAIFFDDGVSRCRGFGGTAAVYV